MQRTWLPVSSRKFTLHFCAPHTLCTELQNCKEYLLFVYSRPYLRDLHR